MIKKRLNQCENIFLDSGVIIDLLKTDLTTSSPDVVLRVNQIKQFFAAINSDSFPNRKVFQISSISISEIFHLDNNQDDTPEAIMTAFNSEEVEIYSFDVYSAVFHNKDFYKLLGNKAITELRESVTYPVSIHANIKDRIRKDMLIAATAKLYSSDIVLTNDSGFKQLCDKLDLACHFFTGNPDDFLTSNDGVIIYDFA